MNSETIEKYYYNTTKPVKVILKSKKHPLVGFITGGFKMVRADNPDNFKNYFRYFFNQIENYENYKKTSNKDNYPLTKIEILRNDIVDIEFAD